MRVGISIGTTFDPADSARAPRSVLAQADAAVRAGLDRLTVGDRHSHRDCPGSVAASDGRPPGPPSHRASEPTR